MPPHTRRAFLGQLAATTLGAAVPVTLHGQSLSGPAKRKPNVLFIMSDDMRVELGCYASMFNAKTPNLDALAKAGVRFDRNYCQFPLCNPSRASLLTGRNPTQTSVLGNRTDFRVAHPDWTTLPQLFKENGYVTVRAGKIYHGGIDDAKSWSATSDKGGATDDGSGTAVGKTMVLPRVQIPMPDGVLPPLPADNDRAAYSDRIVVLEGNGEGHGDYQTADRTIANLRKYKDQPFFIACGFVKPHSPPTAPQRFFDLYDVDKIQLTPDFAAWPTVPPGFPSAGHPQTQRRSVHRSWRRAKPRPSKSSAPISPRFPGAIGTSVASSLNWTTSVCATTRSSSSSAITAISLAKKANGRRPAPCLKWARAFP